MSAVDRIHEAAFAAGEYFSSVPRPCEGKGFYESFLHEARSGFGTRSNGGTA